MINLTPLPFLNIIEPVSYEDNKQNLLNIFYSLTPTSELTEASDEMVLLEAFAYALTYKDAAINQRIKNILPTYASGTNLDTACLNFYGTERLLGETDNDFLVRSIYSLQQSNTAGSQWSYLYHTSSADEHIVDVLAFRSNAGEVTIVFYAVFDDAEVKTLLGILDDDLDDEQVLLIETKKTELLTALETTIKEQLNADKVRPLNELQIVKQATEVNYTIQATLKTKASTNGDIAKEEAYLKVYDFVNSLKIGNEVKRSKLISLLHVDGVGEVMLLEPSNNIIVNKEGVAICTEIVISQEVEVDE